MPDRVHYCGVVPAANLLGMCVLEELREDDPPVRLAAVFFEPGTADQVAAQVLELEDVVVAVAAPMTAPAARRDLRTCDQELRRRGVRPQPPHEGARRLFEELAGLGLLEVEGDELAGLVGEGTYRLASVFETNADGVFCALRGRRLPARRHPLGVQMRIQELEEDHVIDDSGDLWHRRIEEVDAAGAALCAHRYAVGHASWLGEAAEGVVVLPGARIPERFESRGVLPPVERVRLPEVDG